MKKRILYQKSFLFILVLTAIITFSFPSISLIAKTSKDVHENEKSEEEQSNEEEVTELSLDDAIQKGLENSIILERVKNQVELAKLANKNTQSTKIDLYNATDELRAAAYELDNARINAYDSMADLDSVEAAIDNGIIPASISPTGTQITFDQLRAVNPQADQIIAGIKAGIADNKQELDDGLERFESAKRDFQNAQSEYDSSVTFAMLNVASKLGTSTISKLDPKPLADLLEKMADVSNEVTAYSYNIYKNQAALLIQKSYYDALKQEKLLESKEKSRERGAVQYQLAEAAYEVGAKSKDDMLLAKSYYDGTNIAYQLQQKEYQNAMIELKKNLNMPLDQKISLVEREPDPNEDYKLDQGIKTGLTKRLEVKKVEAQLKVYKQLKSSVNHSGYSKNDNQYKEADLLIEKGEIELKNIKLDVEAEIRQSYETFQSTKEALQASEDLVKNANENLQIAIAKYEAGYGVDNALLEKLNLGSMSGTMVEIIAAQENLASIEEKVIEITNGYNLARSKYLNDIGILPY